MAEPQSSESGYDLYRHEPSGDLYAVVYAPDGVKWAGLAGPLQSGGIIDDNDWGEDFDISDLEYEVEDLDWASLQSWVRIPR